MLKSLYSRITLSLLRLNVKPYHSFVDSYAGIDQQLLANNKKKLESHYNYYVSNISRADMAASLELAAFIYTICHVKGFKKLLDVGSGFSSYVFRLYAFETPGVTVYSIDDDVLWLDKTKNYLLNQRVSIDNLFTLDAFLESGVNGFDCILHDMNFVEVRIKYVEEIIKLIKPDGLIIMDDVHKPYYTLPLLKKLKGQPVSAYDLKTVTFDQFGRYALAVVKD